MIISFIIVIVITQHQRQHPSNNNDCREERSSRSPATLSDPKWGKHKFINVNGQYDDDDGDDDNYEDDAGNIEVGKDDDDC